ncbi:MAG: hypothetical protein IJS60_10870 [Abditibacteriota bacterium]|nr:hypothetical protein [Abditibacteriota bacterium]
MILRKFFILIGILSLMGFIIGCGGSANTDKDDNDVKKTMEDLEDGIYYTLSQIVDLEEDEDNIHVIYERNKFVTHERDVTLIDEGIERPIDAYMEIQVFQEDVTREKSIDMTNKFFVAFSDGQISLVELDQDILDTTVTSANIISEYILCPKTLKAGYKWISPNGYYSEIVRFEYVVIENMSRTAESFRIDTYTDESKTQLVNKIWWTPDIGWCCQWQEYTPEGELSDYMVLTDLSYDWEDDDD